MKYILTVILLGMSLFGSCVTNVVPSSDSERFVDNEDGTISDNKTGLVWQKCNYGLTFSDGICGGSTEVMTWGEALQIESDIDASDEYVWRVPTIKELHSITERACSAPALLDIFDYEGGIAQRYWSSTHAESTGRKDENLEAMMIDFTNAQIGLQNKMDDTNITLRLVRIRQ